MPPITIPRTLALLDRTMTSHWWLAEALRCLRDAGYPVTWAPASEVDPSAFNHCDMVLIDGAIEDQLRLDLARGATNANRIVALAFARNPISSSTGLLTELFEVTSNVITMAPGLGRYLAPYLDFVPLTLPAYVDPRPWPQRSDAARDEVLVKAILLHRDDQVLAYETEDVAAMLERSGVRFEIISHVYSPLDLINQVAQADIGLCLSVDDDRDPLEIGVDALLFGAARVPIVALPGYRGVVGRTATVVARPSHAEEVLAALAGDAPRRFTSALRLHERVTSRWNLATHVDEVAQVLRTAYRRALAGMRRVRAA